MGYALITAEIGDGRYTIELDWGEAQRVALANAAATALAALEIKVAQQQDIIDAADAEEAALQTSLNEIFAVIVEQLEANPTGAPAAQQLFEQLLGQLRALQAQNSPKRIAMRTLKGQRSLAVKRLATWNNLVCLVTRNAWCADLTQDASGYVATLEIPGESDLILIAPGAPVPNNSVNGFMRARELMSPEQAFFNVAILPGWQKFLPTFRWGTITAIDDGTETVSVALFAATSSAQRLGVNQASTLSGVAVEYMECGYSIFEVGDDVVVQFVDQDWSQPKVIGFLDNPRGCNWGCSGITTRGFSPQPQQFTTRDQTAIDALYYGSPVIEGRVNRGAWMTLDPVSDLYGQKRYQAFTTDDIVYLSIDRAVQTSSPNPWNSTPPAEIVGAVGISASPPGSSAEPESIWEIRITVDGDLVLNAAVEDSGAGGANTNSMRVKSRGGIVNNWGLPVTTLGAEYLLFSQTGD